ncbi:MAG: hypothetical protein ACUZ8O_09905 [Candidatus Anammoxibacter sp.]
MQLETKRIQQFYTDHGVKINNCSNGELAADCPYCDKPGHFYINRVTGLGNCKKCHTGSNPYKHLEDNHGMDKAEIFKTLEKYGLNNGRNHAKGKPMANTNFLKIHLESLKRIASAKLQELAEERKFTNVSKGMKLLEKYKIGVDNLGNWLIPIFDLKNILAGIQRFHPKGVLIKNKNGQVSHYKKEYGTPIKSAAMAGSRNLLFGIQSAINNPDIHTLIICESPFKAVHMQLNGFDGSNGVLAISVIGAGNFPKDQASIVKNIAVIFCYDWDIKPDGSNPGQDGVMSDAKKIIGIAKSVRNITPTPEIINQFKTKKYDKVDLADDYWVEGGTIEEFTKLMDAAKPVSLNVSEKKQEQSNPYFVEEGYLYRTKKIKGHDIPVKLANFSAEITSETTKDNGLEQFQNYTIQGELFNKRRLQQIDIPSLTFSTMNWVNQWGTQAIIEPGQASKDYIRHYIQLNSKAKRITCFTHTGWRKIKDKWCYLTSSGAIGVNKIKVELSQELQRYFLPLEIENEVDAIKTSLSFLDIGKHEITYPLFALLYLSPLTTILDPMPNFSGYIYGDTGTFKTTLAVLLLSYFGDFNGISDLANFDDTANNVEKKAFTLKDTLMVLDDYHPSGQRIEALKKESLAQRIIRAFSNRTARGRLNSDCTEKARYSPRGMLLVTGEELVSVSSTLARTMIVEISKDDIDKKKLTEIQNKAALLPHAMASYISWLKDNIDDVQQSFKQRFTELRTRASDNGSHGKYPEQIAFLTFALETALSWMTDKEVITDDRASDITDKAWGIFTENIEKQMQHLRDECPIQRFKDIINTALDQKKVRIEIKDISTQEKGVNNDNDGELIGYTDDAYYYLLPQATWNLIDTYGGYHNHFPVSKNTLWNLLVKRNMAVSMDNRNVIAVKIRGKNTRVLKLFKETLTEPDTTR